MAQAPERCCDLVMKGGITSGVVYPPVVVEAARRFVLVGIAGTSAGAIAASLAAAAEYRRRRSGDARGFEMVGELSNQLAEPGAMLELFSPDRSTRKLFSTLVDLAENGFGLRTGARAALRLLRLKRHLRAVVDNGFGLCSGMAQGNRKGGAEPLTEWLAKRIDEIAGKADGTPLTFRDLHGAPVPEVLRRLAGDDAGGRSIDYRAVTTCLTFGRPFELPWDTEIFAFDPGEWRRLFPGYVVDFLIEKSKEMGEHPTLERDGKLPLPTADLPIVVATRMSLSFPVLLSMVPLWAVDYRKRTGPEDPPLERVWFSDGGITSNFPMHRFDALYPLWPTLGVTLAAPRRAGEDELVYMPKRRADGRLDRWSRFAAGRVPIRDLFGFLGAIFSSAQNWHDDAFMTLQGYRDRAVEIGLRDGEGGLNLSMPKEVILELAARGHTAGERLTDRFASDDPEDPMGWDGHRWTRFRVGMKGLATELRELRHGVAAPPMAGGTRITEWLDGSKVPPSMKHETQGQRAADEAAFGKLVRFLDELAAQHPEPFLDERLPEVERGTRAPMGG